MYRQNNFFFWVHVETLMLNPQLSVTWFKQQKDVATLGLIVISVEAVFGASKEPSG